MHVVFRESHGLEETAAPFDPGQDPADMLVLSFSDSDLGAFGAGWHRASGTLPSLRLCNLIALRHPVSVDTYIERTARHARLMDYHLGQGNQASTWLVLELDAGQAPFALSDQDLVVSTADAMVELSNGSN